MTGSGSTGTMLHAPEQQRLGSRGDTSLRIDGITRWCAPGIFAVLRASLAAARACRSRKPIKRLVSKACLTRPPDATDACRETAVTVTVKPLAPCERSPHRGEATLPDLSPLPSRCAGAQSPAKTPSPRLRGGRRIAGKAILHYYAKFPTRDCEHIMTTLTVTARGQVTFRKEVLQHLGIKPGEKIELDLLPNGRGMLKAARPTGTIDGFIGLLADRTQKVATIEEINAATAQAWAGKE